MHANGFRMNPVQAHLYTAWEAELQQPLYFRQLQAYLYKPEQVTYKNIDAEVGGGGYRLSLQHNEEARTSVSTGPSRCCKCCTSSVSKPTLDERRLRHFEGGFDTLCVIEAWVARGFVVEGQHVLGDADASTEALCDGLLPRCLHMDATENAAASPVHCDALHYLRNNVVHVPGLQLVALCNDPIAVHSVALPHHRHASGLHGLDVLRDHAHLQDELHLGLEAVRLTIDEAFGAIAALYEEAFATASCSEQLLQPICLTRLHKGRQAAQLAKDAISQCL